MRRLVTLFVSLLLFEAGVAFQPRAPALNQQASSLQQSVSTTTEELPEMNGLPSMETFNHDLNTPPQVDQNKIRDDINISSTVDNNLPLAPHVTFNKFLTMQVRHSVILLLTVKNVSYE
jgi:hypothetical protein